MSDAPKRIVVAGTGGDSGKTLVSLGLAAAWRQSGLRVAAFKKGPDYIDAAWLSRAAGRPARNLDAWIMGPDGARDSFLTGSRDADVCVVEGNRGVLDGYGGHSTAALAMLIDAPVLLVIDVTKTTKTAAAVVAGVRALEPGLRLAGVVANRVGGGRHRREVTKAVEEATGIPVLGAIPKLSDRSLLPDRHLGLVPPEEHGRMAEVVRRLAEVCRQHVDLATLFDRAVAEAPRPAPLPTPASRKPEPGVRIGVFMDSAFTFYYPENLEALRAEGAEIVPISTLTDPVLPDVDLLYAGGGFPETQAEVLSGNRSLLWSLRDAVSRGLPVYAECGGLIYLCRSVTYGGRRTEMANVLPFDVEIDERPQGHGYAEMLVSAENPFFPEGTLLRGHEFHHARLTAGVEDASFAFDVRRGTGSAVASDGETRKDGVVSESVLASWLHLHALGTPEWAPALVRRARLRRREVALSENESICGSATR